MHELIIDSFRQEAITDIIDKIKANNAILALVFNNCRMEDASLIRLAPHISELKQLYHLDLRGCHLTSKSYQAFRIILKITTLRSLRLGNNLLGVEGTCRLATLLNENNALTYLDLENNNLGKDSNSTRSTSIAVTALLNALRKNSALQYLNLAQNDLGASSFNELATWLRQNQSLVELNVAKNNIGVDSIYPLAKAIVGNKTLERLVVAPLSKHNRKILDIEKILQNNIRDKIRCRNEFILLMLNIGRGRLAHQSSINILSLPVELLIPLLAEIDSNLMGKSKIEMFLCIEFIIKNIHTINQSIQDKSLHIVQKKSAHQLPKLSDFSLFSSSLPTPAVESVEAMEIDSPVTQKISINPR